jgi:uncharacterized membrane protein
MVGQTQMNQTNGETQSVPKAAARHLAEVLHDLVSLAELQLRLFGLDARQAARRIWKVTAVAVLGLVVLASCVPFALITIALAIVYWSGISYAAAFGWTLLGGFILGVVLLWAASAATRSASSFFDRSKSECAENVQWAKGVLKRFAKGNEAVPDEPAHTDFRRR